MSSSGFGSDDGGSLAFNPGRIGTNVDTDYEPDVPVNVDEAVRRIEPVDARARRSRELGPIPLILGKPYVPVLSLHDLGDLFVPFSMEQEYAEDVANKGRSELLVQRAIRAIGHCEFSAAEVAVPRATALPVVPEVIVPPVSRTPSAALD